MEIRQISLSYYSIPLLLSQRKIRTLRRRKVQVFKADESVNWCVHSYGSDAVNHRKAQLCSHFDAGCLSNINKISYSIDTILNKTTTTTNADNRWCGLEHLYLM